jgi:chemotaxis protein methyltransferase CheR
MIVKNEVLPYLHSYHHIKIWCAGCATGEEPYSMAILLNDMGILNRCQIFATDFNPIIIEQAKNGLFPLESLKISEQNYKAAGGASSFRGNFSFYGQFMKIKDTLREKILFFNHNLTTDGVFNEFQLILCRNVLIYFDLKLQGSVLKLFNDSLDMSGFLVLGESENIRHNTGDLYFKPYDAKSRIFKKQISTITKMERKN